MTARVMFGCSCAEEPCGHMCSGGSCSRNWLIMTSTLLHWAMLTLVGSWMGNLLQLLLLQSQDLDACCMQEFHPISFRWEVWTEAQAVCTCIPPLWPQYDNCSFHILDGWTPATEILSVHTIGRDEYLAFSWLLNIPATCKVYLGGGSAWTTVCAATLRKKLQI